MHGLALLEGERVHRVVRAHPLGRLAESGPGLALLLLAALWALAFGSGPGRAVAGGLDGALGPVAVPAVLALWWLGLGVALGSFALRLTSLWPLAYGLAVAVAGGFAAILRGVPDPSAAEAAALLPWATLLAALPPLGYAEALRRSSTWVFTTFRLVHLTGLWHPREESWRLTRLERCNLQARGPRSLDFGDLLVVRKDGDLRIPGVRPVRALRDELELLLHTSPEAPYLGEQRTTAERVGKLLRPGGPG